MDKEKDIWEEDIYELLAISSSATERDIVRAYRKQALKVHPDKNPDDELASKLFHRLTRAYELLKDPIKRNEYDARRKAKEEKAKRWATMDESRRRMRDDLERRELASKKMKESDTRKASISKAEVNFSCLSGLVFTMVLTRKKTVDTLLNGSCMNNGNTNKYILVIMCVDRTIT
jgi:DnaJ-class molecular chaperone